MLNSDKEIADFLIFIKHYAGLDNYTLYLIREVLKGRTEIIRKERGIGRAELAIKKYLKRHVVSKNVEIK